LLKHIFPACSKYGKMGPIAFHKKHEDHHNVHRKRYKFFLLYIPEANTQREKINNPTPRKVMVIPMEIKIHACLLFFLYSPIPNKRRPKPIIEIHSRGKIILPPSGISSHQ